MRLGLLAAPAPRGRLQVAAPIQHGVTVLGDILEQISLIDLHSHGLIAPDMLAAPIPAFPAIGLPGLQRIATAKVEEVCLRSMGRVDDLRLAMTVRLAQNRKRAIGVVDALYLGPAISCVASSQLIWTYLDLPLFWGFLSPLGSQSTRFIGCRMRFLE